MRRLLDALVTRVMRLPAPAGRFRIDRGLRVPMRDGVRLAADHYIPAGQPLGTLLVRGPYGRNFPYDVLYARLFASRGYHVLFVSSRGTAASEGEFDPMRTELEDGQDVVAHLVDQPWFTGTFATVGPSYLGYTQWTLLTDPPPQMVAAIVTVGPHDFARHVWGTGAFNLDMVGWADMVGRQPRSDRPVGLRGALATARRESGLRRARERLYLETPFADAADRHFAGRAPWFRDRVTRPDLDDPFWTPMRHPSALESSGVPILLIGGWQDLFLRQTVEQYTRLHERGQDVAMTIGPWNHVEAIGKGGAITFAESLDWLAAKLAELPGHDREFPVRLHVTGAREWRGLPSWPPPSTTRTVELVFGRDTFLFDPADPTPTMGGPLLDNGGYVDDSALAARDDVLTFTGPPLPDAVEVIGTPAVELTHSADIPHTDLFVRLSDVDPRGRSRNVTEGYVRLERSGGVRVELLPTAHRFAAGHRLRLLIAGGSNPQYLRNLGTDENPALGTVLRPARHTVTSASLLLPIPVP